MVYDYSKLNGKIVEVFGTQNKFAEAMGLSARSVSLKLNNLVSWKQPEISKAATLLNIDSELILEYFFTVKVQETWTKKHFKKE